MRSVEQISDVRAWSQYWEGGRIACCLGPAERPYDEHIKALWTKVFSNLAPDARILDLCTGNGAVALMAAAYSQSASRDFQITGVDLAEIDPKRTLKQDRALAERVKFIGGVDVTHDLSGLGEFDLITSQFGLEYADWESAIAPIWSQLATGGRLQFLVHAKGGDISDGALTEIQHAMRERPDLLLSEAQNIVQGMAGGEASPRKDAFFERLVEFAQNARTDMSKAVAQAVDQALRALGRLGNDQILAHLSAFQESVDAHLFRINALAGAALSKEDVERMGQLIEAQGGVVSLPQSMLVHPQFGAYGWLVTAQKQG